MRCRDGESLTFCGSLGGSRGVLGDGVGGGHLGLYCGCGGVGGIVRASTLVVSLGDRAVGGISHIDLGGGDMAISAASLSPAVTTTDIGSQSRRGEGNE